MKCITRYSPVLEDVLEALVKGWITSGKKVMHAVYEPFDNYLEYLKEKGYEHEVRNVKNEGKFVFVLADENYRSSGYIAGIGIIECLLEGETLKEAIKKYLEGEYEEIALTRRHE